MWTLSLAAPSSARPPCRHWGCTALSCSHLAAGAANGLISAAAVSGTVIGLLVAGVLHDRWGGLGKPLLLLSLGPVLMAVLVLVAYPETSRRELEQLNPEDPSLTDGAAAIPGAPPTR